MAIAFEPSFDQFPEFLCKSVVVEEVVHPEPRSRSFARVGRANALLCSADAGVELMRTLHWERRQVTIPGSTEFYFFESIDYLVEVEDEVGTIRHKKTAFAVKTLAFKSFQLLEERRQVNDNAIAYQTRTLRVNKSYEQKPM